MPDDPPTDASSLTYSTYLRLRAEVLSGRLQPNHKLKVQEFSEQLDVSQGVVREALSRLAAERLVVATPQRGFRVAPVSAEEVRDLTQARIEIERICLRRSITRGDLAWEAGIVSALHQLNRTPANPAELDKGWIAAHTQFHDSLVRACDSIWLLRLREQLGVQGERYRWINVRMSGESRDLREEHREIADTAISRDIERTCELMEHHLRLTETLTLRSLEAETRGAQDLARAGLGVA